MSHRRGRPTLGLLVVVSILATAGSASIGAAAPASDCIVADPALEGAPPGVPVTDTVPLRNDPDGARTLLLAVDDPVFGGDTYAYTTVADQAGTVVGAYAHRWPVTRRLVTYGLFVLTQGTRYRVPLFLVENGADDNVAPALLVAAMNEALPLLNNSSPFAVNTAVPASTTIAVGGALVVLSPALVAALVPVVGPMVAGPMSIVTSPVGGAVSAGASMYGNTYPPTVGFSTTPPVYVWTAYRNAGTEQLWAGSVTMHSGTYSNTPTMREGCRRTRIGIATRTSTGTTYGGGVYVLDHAVGTNNGDDFEATETITGGITAGGTDVPVTSVHQTETKQGTSPFTSAPGYYPSYQRDEITLNARVGGTFVPLVGTRAEAAFAAPPQAERRLFSAGVYDPLGAYHPVVGGRTHFEKVPGDAWPLFWAGNGGPGGVVGDWEADLGAFDPTGVFVPVFGVTYDDAINDVPATLYQYQMMITVGPWVAGTYHPALGVTYDGEDTFVDWALFDASGAHAAMGKWLVSAGTFSPLGPYVPLAGASYQPGTNPPYPVVEEYRIGTFAAAYPDFVPVAEARWSGYTTSAAWAAAYALSRGGAMTEAQLDVGPVVAGTFAPVAGMHARPGRPQHFDFGAWVLSNFTPLLTACFSPPTITTPVPGVPSVDNGSVGIAVAGMPVAWVGSNGGPAGGALADCPA